LFFFCNQSNITQIQISNVDQFPKNQKEMSTSSENKSIPFQNAVVPPGQLQMNERKCMWCEEKNNLLSSMTIPRYIACYNHYF